MSDEQPLPSAPTGESESFLRRWTRNRMLSKIALVSAIALLLNIPMSMVRDLIDERQARRETVRAEFAQKWGGEIRVLGPVLVVPGFADQASLFVYPSGVTVTGDVDVRERWRGIYRVSAFTAEMETGGAFSVPAVSTAGLDWSRATLQFFLTGETGGMEIAAETGTVSGGGRAGQWSVQGTQWSVPVTTTVRPGSELPFRARVRATGIGMLELTPLGRGTQVALKSNWPTPSFLGDRLPADRTLAADGFSANWKLQNRRSEAGHAFSKSLPAKAKRSETVGVRFAPEISSYQRVTRAAKYALLLIFLTFGLFFALECSVGPGLHPMQYLFVGFSMVVFYVLLLAQAEHMSFRAAYCVATAAVVALVATYARSLLGRWRRAGGLALMLVALYAGVYVILSEARFALLIGAWAVFAFLAVLMFLTRRTDWAALGRGVRSDP